MGETLRPKDLAIIRAVLAPYADRLRRVALFGSRAVGTARPNSDIDLALWGDLDFWEVARISGEFEESNLPVTVDVIHYDTLSSENLRRSIDRDAVDLPIASAVPA